MLRGGRDLLGLRGIERKGHDAGAVRGDLRFGSSRGVDLGLSSLQNRRNERFAESSVRTGNESNGSFRSS